MRIIKIREISLAIIFAMFLYSFWYCYQRTDKNVVKSYIFGIYCVLVHIGVFPFALPSKLSSGYSNTNSTPRNEINIVIENKIAIPFLIAKNDEFKTDVACFSPLFCRGGQDIRIPKKREIKREINQALNQTSSLTALVKLVKKGGRLIGKGARAIRTIVNNLDPEMVFNGLRAYNMASNTKIPEIPTSSFRLPVTNLPQQSINQMRVMNGNKDLPHNRTKSDCVQQKNLTSSKSDAKSKVDINLPKAKPTLSPRAEKPSASGGYCLVEAYTTKGSPGWWNRISIK